MKTYGLILLCVLCVARANAQEAYSEFTETIDRLYDATSVDKVWEELISKEKIPFVSGDSVAFMYRGEANTVVWMGDFNGWGYNKEINNRGIRIPGTNLWIFKASMPEDARLDYKILINDKTWILDPANPATQWSGVGGGSLNSELRMPKFQEDPLTASALPQVTPGSIQKDILLNSRALGYQVTYSVYTPTGYRRQETYPILYVTDGYEYMHERMGNMITVLDNLIHLQKIQPVMVVFIDHRDPLNRSVNRRMQELAMNEKYLSFITAELIPTVEKEFSLSLDPSQRAIIGTSMGGLSAAWFSFSKPDVFGMAGIQSPAFWFKPEIYTVCDTPEAPPVKIFMTTGLINDAEEGTRKMKKILEKNTCTHELREVNQGHSWGNWRDLIDDMLVYLIPK